MVLMSLTHEVGEFIRCYITDFVERHICLLLQASAVYTIW